MERFKFQEKYNFKNDNLMKHNLFIKNEDDSILNFCNAYIQTYTNDVIKNKTHYYFKQL